MLRLQLIFIVSIVFVLTACSESSQSGVTQHDTDMFKLARMNGCMECHRVNATVIGPSWVEIAERYRDGSREEMIELMVERVKKGSSGNWLTFKGGNGMPPMERRVSEQHIRQIVTYILDIKAPSSTF